MSPDSSAFQLGRRRGWKFVCYMVRIEFISRSFEFSRDRNNEEFSELLNLILTKLENFS